MYKPRVAVDSLSNSERLKSGTVSFKVLAKSGLSSLCEEHKTLAVFVAFLFIFRSIRKSTEKGFAREYCISEALYNDVPPPLLQT